jgi:AcrR family transcriptional regulator
MSLKCVNIHWTAMASEMTAPPPRVYRKRRRAEQEAETRRHITEAAVKLHGTVGPARTTISGIAAEAGVQRATVYRHFPDREAVFMACSAHWASMNPPPDPAVWERIADPDERLRRGLGELYDWYVWAEPMLINVRRDAEMVPAPIREASQQRYGALAAVLMRGRRARGRPRARVAAAIGHALDFETWRSLTREHGLETAEAFDLMVDLVSAAGSARR